MGVATVLDYQNANLMAGVFNQVVLTLPVAVPSDFVAVFVGTFGLSSARGEEQGERQDADQLMWLHGAVP